MFDLHSFFAGLILGDSSSYTPPSKKTFDTNIALQDIVFCQKLRNTLDEAEEFVANSSPSPEEFIKFFLPDISQYTEPYTSDEKKVIETYYRHIEEYTHHARYHWVIDRKSASMPWAIDWRSTSVIQEIWTDLSHAPDFDNLHLLFAADLLQDSIKFNGRVYEYYGHPCSAFNKFAEGFFETNISRLILSSCRGFAQRYMKKLGYHFDHSRFEYNYAADKADALKKWREDCRKREYWNLLNTDPSFCKNPWSPLTRKLKLAHQQGVKSWRKVK